MRKVIALLTFVFLINVSNAQVFVKGGNYIHTGFGLQPYSIGPISVGYEMGLTQIMGIGRFGVGVVLAHEFYFGNTNALGIVSSTQNRTTLMGRGAYHFDFNVERMDGYAGAAFAIQFRGKIKDKNTGAIITNNTPRIFPYPTFFAGIRYYLKDQFAVYAEVGYGLGFINGGIVYRF